MLIKCKSCGKLKNETEFYKIKNRWISKSQCKNCSRKRCRDYYQKHRARLLKYSKKYRQTHDRNLARERYLKKKRRKQIRMEVLIHYGGNPPKCACRGCNEYHIEFLCIDHIDGKGNEHRRKIGVVGGTEFYRWLIKNNFPKGLRVLCYNCNHSQADYGYCPHQREKTF